MEVINIMMLSPSRDQVKGETDPRRKSEVLVISLFDTCFVMYGGSMAAEDSARYEFRGEPGDDKDPQGAI